MGRSQVAAKLMQRQATSIWDLPELLRDSENSCGVLVGGVKGFECHFRHNVISTGIPNTVTVLKNDSSSWGVLNRRGMATSFARDSLA